MKRIHRTAAASLLGALAAACTTQSAYQTGQEWQRQQCLKLPDLAERQRCEKSTSMGYDKYRAEAEAVKSKPAP
jgi:hypothetical protein